MTVSARDLNQQSGLSQMKSDSRSEPRLPRRLAKANPSVTRWDPKNPNGASHVSM